MSQHVSLAKIRTAVLSLAPSGSPQESAQRRWLRRRTALPLRLRGEGGTQSDLAEQGAEADLTATPAADVTLSTAAKLAGGEPVGSHHLLLAALTDANSAAARVLASLGVDLNQAKDALRDADVAGTSDEQPEEAGRRQMNIKVTSELVTIVAADPVLVKAARSAVAALGDAAPGAVILGANLQGGPSASLAKAWQALHDTFSAIKARERAESGTEDEPDADPAASDPGAA
jgi:ATP-dependent Clp protease ATP-binding subunit ClpC